MNGATKKITIPYQPRTWAIRLHNSLKRWIVIVAHRRCGKTIASINHLQRDALRIPESRWAYIAPTYKQAKNIVWDEIKKYSSVIDGIQYNESELTVIYPNGSKIRLYGSDNPDSLRGISLWGVIFDEYSQQPSNIFTEIIAPSLADHQGYAIWIGTPKGKNDFYKTYQKALNEQNWESILLKASETGIIPQEELDIMRRNMSEDEYNQEFECSFDASVKGAYYAKELEQARKDNRITNVELDRFAPVMTAWDIGYSDSTAIVIFQKIRNELRVIDYYENSGESLDHYVQVLRDKGYNYSIHYLPHDARAKSMQTGYSIEEVMRKQGLRVEVLPAEAILAGINAVRMTFNRIWIDKEKCEKLIDALSQYQKEWDEKRGEFKDKPLHDWTSHGSDAFRYMCMIRENKPLQVSYANSYKV